MVLISCLARINCQAFSIHPHTGSLFYSSCLSAGFVVFSMQDNLLAFQASFFTQGYEWIPKICWDILTECWGVTCDGLASYPGGVKNVSSNLMLHKPWLRTGTDKPSSGLLRFLTLEITLSLFREAH